MLTHNTQAKQTMLLHSRTIQQQWTKLVLSTCLCINYNQLLNIKQYNTTQYVCRRYNYSIRCLHSHNTHQQQQLQTKNQSLQQHSNHNLNQYLFNNPYLQSIDKFYEWQNITKQKCDAVLRQLEYNLNNDKSSAIQTINYIDLISDYLCILLDTCELLRNVHSNTEYRNTADTIYNNMYKYMESLNTNIVLYKSIKTVLSNDILVKQLTNEQLYVAKLLEYDMIQHGILQDKRLHTIIQSIVHDISILQSQYIDNIHNIQQYITLTCKHINELPVTVLQYITNINKNNDSSISITLHNSKDNNILNNILYNSKSSNIRKQAYIIQYKQYNSNINILNTLVYKRYELAKYTGYNTYTDYVLHSMYFNNTYNVQSFLHNTINKLHTLINDELYILKQYKYNDLNEIERQEIQYNIDNVIIYQYDYLYYTNKVKQQLDNNNNITTTLYRFKLDDVMNSLILLCKHMFNLELRKLEFNNNNENTLWHDKILCYALYNNSNECIGHIYFDLYERNNKFNGSASFTIQCSRQLYELYDNDNNQRQLPIIVLVCNIQQQYNNNTITHHDLETIYHEFGHCLQHCISYTQYQHVSGTRANIDVVEIASTLIEQFVYNYDWLKYCFNNITQQQYNNIIHNKYTFYTLDLYNYIIHSLYDQMLYSSELDSNNTIDSTYVLQQLTKQYHIIQYDNDIMLWHSNHSHLCHYSASYYVYLFNRLIALQLYNTYFNNNNFDKFYNGGQYVYHKLLRIGGSQTSVDIVNNLLSNNSNNNTQNNMDIDIDQLVKHIQQIKHQCSIDITT